MTAKYEKTHPQLKFAKADVRHLSEVQDDEKQEVYHADTYDAVIDKACLDSVLCADYSGPNGKLFLGNVNRVLNDQGVYISISYGVPNSRMKAFVPKGE